MVRTFLITLFFWSIVGLSAYALNKLEHNIKQERNKNG